MHISPFFWMRKVEVFFPRSRLLDLSPASHLALIAFYRGCQSWRCLEPPPPGPGPHICGGNRTVSSCCSPWYLVL